MFFETETLKILTKALGTLEEGFSNLPQLDQDIDYPRIEESLIKTAERLKDNYPYFHPLYAGQMLKPPHVIAKLAYMMSLYINPNNHALDGGKASSAMEKELIADLAGIFGYKNHLGHLCSGGTIANLEALWVASCLHKGKKIVASTQAHYTHERMTKVLGVDFEKIDVTSKGIMDMNHLEELLIKGNIGTVVLTLGTTGAGLLEPLDELVELKNKYNFRIHVDGAYGGYFVLAENLSDNSKKIMDALPYSDSITIDPHKHGLQPYGCGCIIFKDPEVGKFYKHDSPYTYFSSDEMHLGEITLECSRPGASAIALWTTMQMLPLKKGGIFAEGLEKSRDAAVKLYNQIKVNDNYITFFKPDLDIVIFAPKGNSFSEISKKSRETFVETAKNNLHLALFELPSEIAKHYTCDIEIDCEKLTCLRVCLMKPEHLDWIDEILRILG